jgi:hypothetical protein
MRLLWLTLLLALLVTPKAAWSAATPDPLDPERNAWFYNRGDATVAGVDQDVSDCLAFGATLRGSPMERGPLASLGNSIINSAIVGSRSDLWTTRFTDACMISRNYRRFEIAAEPLAHFHARFAAMPPAQQLALITADAPTEGVLARQWENGYWLGDNNGETNARAISLPKPDVPGFFFNSSVRPIAGGAPIEASAENSVVTVSYSQQEPRHPRAGVVFARIDPATGLGMPRERTADGRPQLDAFELAETHQFPNGARRVFVLPAGVYAIAYVGGDRLESLCLRTIAFSAPARGAVDLGDVTTDATGAVMQDGHHIGVRLKIVPGDLSEAQRSLSSRPDLVSKLQPAAWRNDATAPCVPWIPHLPPPEPYGVDLPGAAPLER